MLTAARINTLFTSRDSHRRWAAGRRAVEEEQGLRGEARRAWARKSVRRAKNPRFQANFGLTCGGRRVILHITCRPDGLVFVRPNTRTPPARSGRQQAATRGQYYKEVPIKMAVGARVKVTLRCSECKERNYFTFKNKKNTPDRLEMKKYCPRCRKHTVHNETK